MAQKRLDKLAKLSKYGKEKQAQEEIVEAVAKPLFDQAQELRKTEKVKTKYEVEAEIEKQILNAQSSG